MLLTKHRECSICYEPFSADTGATDENIIERIPVQSATCRHYFCLGCILRIHAQKATSNFGVVPERISCCYCSAEDAFCPTRPNYHWMLIDILQRSTTGRFEIQGEWLLCGFVLVVLMVLMGVVGGGTTSEKSISSCCCFLRHDFSNISLAHRLLHIFGYATTMEISCMCSLLLEGFLSPPAHDGWSRPRQRCRVKSIVFLDTHNRLPSDRI